MRGAAPSAQGNNTMGDAQAVPLRVFGRSCGYRLGIRVSHSRPTIRRQTARTGYPRCTFKTEMTDRYDFIALLDVQRRFTSWRHIYNHERPHQALGMATPAERYSRFKQN